MITRLLDAIERASRWPTLRPMPLRWQIVTLVLVLSVLGAAARASADELRVTQIHYLPGSGTVAATISSKGPPNTALAIGLYRGRCPAGAEGTYVDPGVSADGEPHLLLADPPQPGEGGRFALCVWTIHEDGAVGARYSHTVTLPAAKTPSWDPLAGTSHPWWWPFVGWPTLLAIVAVFVIIGVFVPVALIGRFARSAKRHFGRSRQAQRNDGEEGGTLDELRRASSEAAAAGLAGGESPALRYDTVPHPSAPEGQPGSEAAHLPAEALPARGATTATGGHPFTPPAPSTPPPEQEQ